MNCTNPFAVVPVEAIAAIVIALAMICAALCYRLNNLRRRHRRLKRDWERLKLKRDRARLGVAAGFTGHAPWATLSGEYPHGR